MRFLKRKAVTVMLAGGLGNQMFQFCAGAYLANRLGVNLKINATLSQFGRTGHNDWIDCFDLENVQIVQTSASRTAEYVFQLAKFRFYGFATHAMKKLQLERYWKYNIYFRSNVIGYEPELDNIESPVILSGYFQSYKYASNDMFDHSGAKFTLKEPSEWYLDRLNDIKKHRVLSLHIRRGDYLKESQSFGLLSADYYKEALQKLIDIGASWDVIWIFSDQPELAREEMIEVTDLPMVIITPPEGTHSAESLSLMSEAEYLIIGNSTFSWWAAFQSNAKLIVRPQKWFRALQDPDFMFPDAWLSADSSWKDKN